MMIDKILVPIDSIEWDNTMRAVENAIEYSTSCRAEGEPELVLMHVLQSPSGGPPDLKAERLELEKKRIKIEFERIKEMCDDRDLHSVKTVLKEGDPEKEKGVDEAIVEVAQDEDVDLVVIGSGKLHDRSAKGRIKKFFYGSTTERVIHESPCSVLVARPLV